jgi:hypothetical protein
VHVRADARGGGIGTALMLVLFERGAAMSKHVMVGGSMQRTAPRGASTGIWASPRLRISTRSAASSTDGSISSSLSASSTARARSRGASADGVRAARSRGMRAGRA